MFFRLLVRCSKVRSHDGLSSVSVRDDLISRGKKICIEKLNNTLDSFSIKPIVCNLCKNQVAPFYIQRRHAFLDVLLW